jgi:hypothetical protein
MSHDEYDETYSLEDDDEEDDEDAIHKNTFNLLNAIANSPSIECISYKSLYGFVFKIELVDGNHNYDIINLHNRINNKPNKNIQSHIILKLVVVRNDKRKEVRKDKRKELKPYDDPHNGKKYKKRSNTVIEFYNEVNYQIDIYNKTLGNNCIAICPKIFHHGLFKWKYAKEFLDFFDKNVSDDTCTNLISYLLSNIGEKYYLGLIAMEYAQSSKEEGTFQRDDRVTLYNFLIKQPYEPGNAQFEIIDKLLLLLPTLKNDLDFLTKINSKDNYNQIEKLYHKESNKDELEYLARNFFRYRIVAHIIYYMIKAYLVGYIHTDLHAGNIYVLNVTTKFNTCIHPFSLNDTGIDQVNNPNNLFEYFNYKRIHKNYGVSKKCDIIENFCNMSCIEIIDWGRTNKLEKIIHTDFIKTPTFEKLIEIINELKHYYQKFGYLFHLVGLSGDIPDDTTKIDYPQFYVLWLIYNEFKLKAGITSNMKAQNKPTMNCDEINKKSIVINKDFFNKYLNTFKDTRNTYPFYQSYNV